MPVQNRVIAAGGSPPVNEPVKYYYLELRTRVGFDQSMTNAPTVLVHVGPDYQSAMQIGKRTWLLDMIPGTAAFEGLSVGESFSDPAGGVSFAVQSMTAAGATVNVTIANGSGAPTCFDTSGTITPPGPTSCGP